MTTMTLKANQKRYLKALTHNLTSFVNVGKNGLTDEICLHIKNELDLHELMKVKVQDSTELKIKSVAEQVANYCSATILRIIGKTFIIYKRAEHEENRKINLPE